MIGSNVFNIEKIAATNLEHTTPFFKNVLAMSVDILCPPLTCFLSILNGWQHLLNLLSKANPSFASWWKQILLMLLYLKPDLHSSRSCVSDSILLNGLVPLLRTWWSLLQSSPKWTPKSHSSHDFQILNSSCRFLRSKNEMWVFYCATLILSFFPVHLIAVKLNFLYRYAKRCKVYKLSIG